MKFKLVIAAIDLDDELAEGVLAAAASLAAKDGAKLDVVTAWPPLSAMATTFSGEVAASSATITQAVMEQHRAGRRETESKLIELIERRAPKGTAVVVDGDPADAVADYAKKKGADLIVTGSHQRNFWSALFQGSASRELVHEAPCAVFLVTKSAASKLLNN